MAKPLRIHFSNLILLILAIAFTNMSCVSNRKYQYLQDNDVNTKKGEIPKDTVLRTYDLTSYEYRLQPEDIISVQFYSKTDEQFDFLSQKRSMNNSGGMQNVQNGGGLLQGYLIDPKGNIEFSVIGDILVAGLTVFEVQDKLQSIAEQYLNLPIVEVRLLNFRYTILGEVNGEGVFVNYNNRISLLEAIGLSGGFTDLSDKSNVKIIRQKGDKAEVFYVNLLEEGFLSSPDYYVNQNDIIVVPPLKQRPFREYFGENLSVITSTTSFLILIYTLIRTYNTN